MRGEPQIFGDLAASDMAQALGRMFPTNHQQRMIMLACA
jgi:hypothetical protein